MRKRPIILTVLLCCMAPLWADNSQTQTLDSAQLVEMDLSAPVECEGELGSWPERLRFQTQKPDGKRALALEASQLEKLEVKNTSAECRFHEDEEIYFCEFGLGGYVAIDLGSPKLLRHKATKQQVFFASQFRPSYLRFAEDITCRLKGVKISY